MKLYIVQFRIQRGSEWVGYEYPDFHPNSGNTIDRAMNVCCRLNRPGGSYVLRVKEVLSDLEV